MNAPSFVLRSATVVLVFSSAVYRVPKTLLFVLVSAARFLSVFSGLMAGFIACSNIVLVLRYHILAFLRACMSIHNGLKRPTSIITFDSMHDSVAWCILFSKVSNGFMLCKTFGSSLY